MLRPRHHGKRNVLLFDARGTIVNVQYCLNTLMKPYETYRILWLRERNHSERNVVSEENVCVAYVYEHIVNVHYVLFTNRNHGKRRMRLVCDY